MEGVLTDAEVLAHVRPMIFVVDDDGTIIQTAGASVSMMGFSVDDLVGRSALEFVAPRHLEAITFVFAGPGDHVVRDRHAPFPLEVLDRQGRAISCDCAAERVRRDGRVIWIATITPHPFQSASDHALDAYGRGASPLDVASTIAERLAWKWDSASELRTFMLTEPVGGRFTSVRQPGHTGPDDPILTAIAVCLESRTSWSHDHDAAHVVVAVDQVVLERRADVRGDQAGEAESQCQMDGFQ